jgi:flavodoxin
MNIEDKKCLIAYYSRKGQNYVNGDIVDLEVGNTKIAAEMIKDLTNSDIFEIKPIKEYPADYTKTTEVAQVELDEDARPEIKDHIDDINKYDVIFLGYPNWWSTMPMVLFTFLEEYDLSDKIIMPFCTNEGGGMGHSKSDIKKLCSNSDIKEGLSIHGAEVKNSKNSIEKWINDN